MNGCARRCRQLKPPSPPESAFARIGRRIVTVPLYFGATAIATLLLPLLAPLCWAVSTSAQCRGMLRTVAFITAYLWCETIGIAACAWLWLRHGLATRTSGERWQRFLDSNFALQCWWAQTLKLAAEHLFRLRFTVQGAEALVGAPAILLPRHASIADTIIPMVFYAIPQRIRLRYVLKRELLFDPCLDIVGNRLPNCFVARSAAEAAADIDRVASLASDLGRHEGLVIYPEGTRFNHQRQRRVLAGLASRVDAAELERMRTWTELLPPHPGGTRTLINTATDLDLLFCAHVGFEGSSHFSALVNGSWIGARINIQFWRIDRRDVPTDEAAQREFLFAQWDRMQATVVALQRM